MITNDNKQGYLNKKLRSYAFLSLRILMFSLQVLPEQLIHKRKIIQEEEEIVILNSYHKI